jgi:hypothetical protein
LAHYGWLSRAEDDGVFGIFNGISAFFTQVYELFVPTLPVIPPSPVFTPVPGVTAGQLVNMTSQIECQWGSAPMPLTVVPGGTAVSAVNQLAANVSAIAPMTNIPTFVECKSMTNPANATFATTGVYAPCVPAVAAPWTPGCTATKINGLPALNSTNTCICTLGAGTIRVVTSMAPIVNVG